MATQQSYQKDFHAWCFDQAKKLTENSWQNIDIDFLNLAEEMESMGRRERQELRNRLKVLFCHLLKAKYQPEFMGSSWENTIREQRVAIETLLEDSPSLDYCIEELSKDAYRKGFKEAEKEMNKTIPSEASCINKVFTLKQALEFGWMPQETL